MELKKYVLFNNNEISILEELDSFYVKNNSLFLKNGRVWLGDFKKTSDNLLDLVEVGDLVEEVLICQVTSIGHDVNSDITRFYYLLGSIAWFDVKAIYKRQQNGDFKRYEVKE